MRDPGPYSLAHLRDAGLGAAELRELLAQGRLRRIRRGWFAEPRTPAEAVRALELGGRLGCLSACRVHGLWVPPDRDLHVVLNPGFPAPVPPPPRGVQFHRLRFPCRTGVAPLGDAVAQVLQRHDTETALVVLESAVAGGLLSRSEAHGLLADAPHRNRRAAHFFSPLAQSGSETRLRLFFQRRGVPVEPQAYIPGVGRVDLLVGRSWIIEADSAAHHSAHRDVHVDRGRDLNARELGYDSDRLSHEQIWGTWVRTQQWLSARLSTRRHRRTPVPLPGRA